MLAFLDVVRRKIWLDQHQPPRHLPSASPLQSMGWFPAVSDAHVLVESISEDLALCSHPISARAATGKMCPSKPHFGICSSRSLEGMLRQW